MSTAQSQQCKPQDDYQINIAVGDITCEDAYEIADEYDLDGEKYQDIGSFQCYTGTAQTRPLIFQCVSDSAEFALSEA